MAGSAAEKRELDRASGRSKRAIRNGLCWGGSEAGQTDTLKAGLGRGWDRWKSGCQEGRRTTLFETLRTGGAELVLHLHRGTLRPAVTILIHRMAGVASDPLPRHGSLRH